MTARKVNHTSIEKSAGPANDRRVVTGSTTQDHTERQASTELQWEAEKHAFRQLELMERMARLVQTEITTVKTAIRNTPTTKLTKREKVIRAAIRQGLHGIEYAEYLDHRRLFTHEKWQLDDCPTRYSRAYEIPHWRHQIQREKSRVARRMKA